VSNGELIIDSGQLKPKPATRKPVLNYQLSIVNSKLAAACAAAADELAASRTLIDALEKENTELKSRLDTEKRTTALLTELNETRNSETEALRTALAAKNEALTAKDSVIVSQDKVIETLKRKKSSPWKRFTDVLIGVGLGMILK
jgi:chromosome segregation ATPase